jgi:hypothetical protein
MKDEALKLALEALESCDQVYGSEGSYQYFSQAKVDKAITAIKQARSAPPTHKTARWTDEEYREISDQVISTLVEYGAELDATNRQVEILSDALAESRREVTALNAAQQEHEPENEPYVSLASVQEPVAYWIPKAEQFCIADPSGRPFAKAWEPLYTTPPAQPAVPDALTSADIQEHIEYVAGWNDCRAEMLKGMK